MFNEFVIWFLHMTHSWGLPYSMTAEGWKEVDASLNVLAERNPDFRVVFKGDYDVIRGLIEEDYLPVASSKGFVVFDRAPKVENRFLKLGVL